jgi:hypothetical protein
MVVAAAALIGVATAQERNLGGAGGAAGARGPVDLDAAAERVLRRGDFETSLPGVDGGGVLSGSSRKGAFGGGELIFRGGGEAAATAGTALLWLTVVGVVAFAAVLVAQSVANRNARLRVAPAPRVATARVAVATPEATEPDGDPIEAASRGEFALAVRLLWRRLVSTAYADRTLPPAYTERRAAETAPVSKEASRELKRVAKIVERVRYAGVEADASAFDDARAAAERFETLRGGAS